MGSSSSLPRRWVGKAAPQARRWRASHPFAALAQSQPGQSQEAASKVAEATGKRKEQKKAQLTPLQPSGSRHVLIRPRVCHGGRGQQQRVSFHRQHFVGLTWVMLEHRPEGSPISHTCKASFGTRRHSGIWAASLSYETPNGGHGVSVPLLPSPDLL